MSKATNTFDSLPINKKLLNAIEQRGFKKPTEVQSLVIPVALTGQDVIAIAQTGTGKTLSFVIPIIEQLKNRDEKALILAPTRELALQIDKEMADFLNPFGLTSAVLIGGQGYDIQRKAINRNAKVIVATPGRLIDHLNKRNLRLNNIKILVLDEADRMLDMGFAPQIDKILTDVPIDRQTMLFSATMPQEVLKLSEKYMLTAKTLEVSRSGTPAENAEHKLYIVNADAKEQLLLKLFDQYWGRILVFVRTIYRAKALAKSINKSEHKAAEIHSEKSQLQRSRAMEGFKNGTMRILIATDIAARGIDVAGIEAVINYDLPDDRENYVHRIGRTARAGEKGIAITLATPESGAEVTRIERFIKKNLEQVFHDDFPKLDFTVTRRQGRKQSLRGKNAKPETDFYGRSKNKAAVQGRDKSEKAAYDHYKPTASSSSGRNKSEKRGKTEKLAFGRYRKDRPAPVRSKADKPDYSKRDKNTGTVPAAKEQYGKKLRQTGKAGKQTPKFEGKKLKKPLLKKFAKKQENKDRYKRPESRPAPKRNNKNNSGRPKKRNRR